MDHLPRPFGVELTEEDEVPYVAYNDYHQVPFLDYVKTNEAYQVAPDMLDAEIMSKYESKLADAELERFLQTWLFFGLLQDTLGDLFDHHDFVHDTGSKVVISTKKLPEKLRQWITGPTIDQKHLEQIHQCLQMTYVALAATSRTFDAKVKIGIAATAEVIGTALLLAAKARNISTEFPFAIGRWGDLDETNLRAAEMQKRHGWCPAQASNTLRKFYSLQGKIYLSKLTKPETRGFHHGCSLEKCHALQIDPSTYSSLHRHRGICGDVRSNQEEVVKVLKDGKNALLDLRLDLKSDEISIAIVVAQPSCWYIALSHVWADGLGNTKENSLPQCQLRHIYDLLTSFCTEESIDSGQKRPYLWLDTLCCPVDPEDKLLALAKMPQAYREASQVLLLDSSLTEMEGRHLQPIEVLSRVFSSAWILRLWTLNEANLASKLWIQFRDGIVELGQVHSDLPLMELGPSVEPETYLFTGELDSEYGKLRIESSKNTGGELWYLTEALRYRGVSEVSDEPICVGALLRLDVGVITGKEQLRPDANQEDRTRLRHERMVRLWESIAQGQPAIPKAIIYHVGEKLMEPGLRWAPLTLLNVKNTSPFFCSTETERALPSTRGLCFSSAAFSVLVPERVDSILGRPSTAASSMLDIIKYGEYHWLTFFSTSEQKRYPAGHDHNALYDVMIEVGTGTGFDILVEDPVKKSRDSHRMMNCILVAKATTESPIPNAELRDIRFLRQGWFSHLDRTTSEFLDSLLGEGQVLQNDSISQELRENSKHGDQDARYLDTLKRLLAKVWSLVDRLEAELDATGKHLPESGLGLFHNRRKAIFALLSRFYRNRYLVKEWDFPNEQKYCLH